MPGYGWLVLSVIALVGVLCLAYRYLIIRLAVRHGLADRLADAAIERQLRELVVAGYETEHQKLDADSGPDPATVKPL